MTRVLVDMDGVLADFEGGFLQRWRDQHPEKPFIPLEERNTFYITEQYPAEFKKLIREIFRLREFFLAFDPIPGAFAALNEMRSLGIEVFICTSPLLVNHYSATEKYQWVDQHLGRGWTGSLVLTNDKTIVSGDVLIDDRPEIEGSSAPQWEHILFDQPYNRSVREKRRLTWSNWKDVLLPVLAERAGREKHPPST